MKRHIERDGRTGIHVVVLAVVLLLLAAACGGGASPGGSTATDQPPASPDGAAEPEEEPTQVTLGFACPCLAWAPFVVAAQSGYFEEEGLEIERVVIAGSASHLAAMTAGDYYVGWSGALDVVGAAAAGEPVRLIGLMAERVGNVVSVSNSWIEETGVGPDAPLEERVQALRGATIASGAPGSGGHIFATKLLGEFGVDWESEVTMTAIGTEPAAHNEAMAQGNIDASVLSPPVANIVVAQGNGVAYINPLVEELPGDVGSMSNHGMVATADALDDPERAAVVEAVMRATIRGAELLRTDTEAAVELLAQDEWFQDLDLAILREGVEWFIPAIPEDLAVNEGFVEASLTILRELDRDVPEDVTYEDVVATDMQERVTGSGG